MKRNVCRLFWILMSILCFVGLSAASEQELIGDIVAAREAVKSIPLPSSIVPNLTEEKAYTLQKQMADKDVQHAQELKDKAEQMQVLETQREASLAAARLALTSAAAAKAKAADAEQRVQTLAQQHDVLVGQLKLLSDALVAARDTSNVKDENVVPSIRTWLRARAAADGQRAGNAGAAAAPTAAGPVTAGPAVRPR